MEYVARPVVVVDREAIELANMELKGMKDVQEIPYRIKYVNLKSAVSEKTGKFVQKNF